MYVSETQLRVRYAETDQMGFLYYGNYAAYYEVGRAEAIRALGFTYKQLEELGIIMPVVKLESTYHRPARYDDLITIRTTLKELPAGSSVAFHSELFNEEGKLLNTGITTLVFYDPVAAAKASMHPELTRRLEPFFKGQ
jgi:acyl-CoA thioester hydrolase